MKSRFEGSLRYVRIPALLFVLRLIRWFVLLVIALPRYGKPGLLICALPKSGSSFLEEFLASKLRLKPLVAVSTIWRESFYGDTHNISIGLLDILIVRNFNVIIKTHSLPTPELLNTLADDQLFLLFNDVEAATDSESRHRSRHTWHARHEALKTSADLVRKEFDFWTKRAESVDARFARFHTDSLEHGLRDHFNLPDDDLLYQQVLRRAMERNPDHYQSVK